jgi:outer membrane biogenesis lipoprotein LolB
MRFKECLILGILSAVLALSACTAAQSQESYSVKPGTKQNSVTVTAEELQQYQHVSSEMVVSLGDRFSMILASTPSNGFR